MAKKHRSYYEQYFEGYVYAKVPAKNKNGFKLKRFYVGNYYVHDLDDKQWIQRKLVYSGLTLLCVVLFLVFSLRPGNMNLTSYIAVPGCLSAFCLVFLITGCVLYISCPRKMTKYDCSKSSSYIKRWSYLTTAAIVVTLICCIVFILLNLRSVTLSDIISCIAYTAAAACTYIIHRIEKNTEYYEEYNETVLPFYADSDF